MLRTVPGSTAFLFSLAFFSASVPQPADAQGAEFVYVANLNSNNIAGYKVNPATGGWTAVPGSPFATGGGPNSIAIEQHRRFLYAADQYTSGNGVSGFRIEAGTGRLIPIVGSPFPTASAPTAVAVDPSGSFVYTANLGSNSVSGYRIDPVTGRLTPLAGSPYATGDRPSALTVDQKGKFVYITNGLSGNISGYAIQPLTGGLTPIAGSPFAAGIAPASIAIEPLNRYVYVANQGSLNVSGYYLDPTTGTLTPLAGSPFPAGAGGILGVTVDPQAQHVYVAGYGGIFGYNIQTQQQYLGGGQFIGPGSLQPMSGSPFGSGSSPVADKWTPNSVAVDYTGTFVYATNGQYGTGKVSAYAIYPTNSFQPVGTFPVVTGQGAVAVGLVRPLSTPLYSASQVPDPTILPVQSYFPYAINNKGEVSGSVVFQPESNDYFASGFLYAGGQTITVGNTRESLTFGINDHTQVAGSSFPTPPFQGRPPTQAFLYNNGTTTNLDPVADRQSAAIGINNSGQATGYFTTGTCTHFSCNLGDQRAFLYNGGGLIDLGTLGGNYSRGNGINSNGDIVGGSNLTAGGPSHLFFYKRGAKYDLGTMLGQATEGLAINDQGDIIGSAPVGFLYRNHSFFRLPLLPGGTYTWPTGLNNYGAVAGTCSVAANGAPTHACLYSAGTQKNLNRLVDPTLPLFTSTAGINDRGQIAVLAIDQKMYILTPKAQAF